MREDTHMRTLKFQTECAIFNFDFESVRKHLAQRISDNSAPEYGRQFELLSNTAEDVIEIDQDDHLFGYVILELIKSGTGQVTCKRCDKSHNSSQLKSFALGAGKSPLSPKIDIKRFGSLFYRRKRNPSLIGGIG